MQSNDHTLDFVWFCYTNGLHLSHLAAVGNEIILQVVVILLLPVLVLPALADQPEGDEEALAVGESYKHDEHRPHHRQTHYQTLGGNNKIV